MFSRPLVIVMLLSALLPCPVQAGDVASVLIVSIDALHPDALGQKSSPTLYSVMEKGAFTLRGQSTSPPLTLLSHAAMFSGVAPEEGGRSDNAWLPGQHRIRGETIFHDAKLKGFSTGFFYSKEKLGFLFSDAVDEAELDPDFSVEKALAFLKKPGRKKFCFLHISGLDRAGPAEGWLSRGYMEELFFMDESLLTLVEWVMSEKGYLLVITSDHAGHGTVHGSGHPDDGKLPLIVASDTLDVTEYQDSDYHVTDLRPMLKRWLGEQGKTR